MKLLESIQVGNTTLKNRIMFPPLTTGYEAKDGSITPQSQAFYERLAEGGVSYIVLGDVAPIKTFTPVPKLCEDSQIEVSVSWQMQCINMVPRSEYRFSIQNTIQQALQNCS